MCQHEEDGHHAERLTLIQTCTYTGLETTERWDQDRIYGCVCDRCWPVAAHFGPGQRQEPEVRPWCSLPLSVRRRPIYHARRRDELPGKWQPIEAVTGVGEKGNLCQVDCANRGKCDTETGERSCLDGVILPPHASQGLSAAERAARSDADAEARRCKLIASALARRRCRRGRRRRSARDIEACAAGGSQPEAKDVEAAAPSPIRHDSGRLAAFITAYLASRTASATSPRTTCNACPLLRARTVEHACNIDASGR